MSLLLRYYIAKVSWFSQHFVVYCAFECHKNRSPARTHDQIKADSALPLTLSVRDLASALLYNSVACVPNFGSTKCGSKHETHAVSKSTFVWLAAIIQTISIHPFPLRGCLFILSILLHQPETIEIGELYDGFVKTITSNRLCNDDNGHLLARMIWMICKQSHEIYLTWIWRWLLRSISDWNNYQIVRLDLNWWKFKNFRNSRKLKVSRKNWRSPNCIKQNRIKNLTNNIQTTNKELQE